MEHTPDLRGVFLRGVNEGRGDGKQDPDERKAGSYQQDALQEHGHKTDAKAWEETTKGDNYGYRTSQHKASPASVDNVTNLKGARAASVAVETRPRNVAVYYYIKIN
jgi:hypothetical protein